MEPVKERNGNPSIPNTIEIEGYSLEDKDIPIGQKALRAGIKAITYDELFLRLGANAIKEKRVKDLKEKGYVVSSQDIKLNAETKKRTVITYNTPKSKQVSQEYLDLRLELIPFEEYIDDIIPSRCLGSVKKAKEIGLENFKVVSLKAGSVTALDPIIISIFGERLFEIDLWE